MLKKERITVKQSTAMGQNDTSLHRTYILSAQNYDPVQFYILNL